MNKLDWQDKEVAILGVGVEGMALAEFLSDKVKRIIFLDQCLGGEILDRLEGEYREKAKFLLSKYELISGESYLDDLSDYDVILRSPGISLHNEKLRGAIANGIEISSQIKMFFDLCPCKIIGVTGTKGKGTTASLIFEILRKRYESGPNEKPSVYLAGNIGYPAITLIPKLKSDDIVILELSSFQLMDLEKSPHIAVVTNLTQDHLDYHKDIDEYRASKESILKYQKESDFAVLNSNSTFDSSFIGQLKSNIKYFSVTEQDRPNEGVDAVVEGDSVILDPKNRNIEICNLSNIKLFGRHNLENISAATLVADILDVDLEIVKHVVREFSGLPHRIELVAEIDGVKFINDSFATNPDPTMAAINSFSENKILILGGSSKGADFDDLAEKISDSKVSGVVLIGLEGPKIKASLSKKEFKGKIIEGATTMAEIVDEAMKLAERGDVVIFSPACASFDMFKNYKDRGEKFKDAVLKFHNY